MAEEFASPNIHYSRSPIKRTTSPKCGNNKQAKTRSGEGPIYIINSLREAGCGEPNDHYRQEISLYTRTPKMDDGIPEPIGQIPDGK